MNRSICIPGTAPVDVTGFEGLINHEFFQALRERKQLGVNHLIFPGAVHTRFEHSLGVLALTQRLCAINNIRGDDARHLQAFALLHDIGHGPFSHQVEPVLAGGHHAQGLKIIRAMAAEISRANLDAERLAAMLSGQDALSAWISDRNLGTDKLDYLARDAMHIGFHGTPDIERMQYYTRMTHEGLAIEEKFVEDAKRLQKFYSYLHQHGYLNKTALAAQRMLQRACQERLAMADSPAPQSVWNMGDGELLELLQSAPEGSLCKRLSDALLKRRLYHSFLVLKPPGYAYVEREADKPIRVQERSSADLRAFCTAFQSLSALSGLEDRLAMEYGLQPGDILFAAMPYFRKLIPRDLRVYAKNGQDNYWLFAKDADHKKSLEGDYLRTFAVRLVCPEVYREKLAKSDINPLPCK